MTSVSASSKDPVRARKWLAARVGVTATVMTVLMGAILYKAYTLQIRDGAKMRALGQAQYLHELELPAPRGAILDRHGANLATSVEVPSVFANPREIADPAATARALATVLSLDAADLEDKLASGRRFVWVKRRVSDSEAGAIKQLSLPGVGLSPESKRLYPGGALAGPVLGFAGLDGDGLEGIEHSLDSELRGNRANVPVLRDGRGGVLLHGGWAESDSDALAGDTVTLTIDRVLQHIAERALADGVAENKAKAGVAVVLDAQSGEVLAMASWPSYDPNDPGSHAGARNRVVTDAFEPGSGMKTFTVASALDAGAIRADDSFSIDGGRMQVGPKTIKDTHFHKNILTVGEIIAVSSNVGAAKIARKLGKEGLAAGFRRFGFGDKTDIELPGEQSGKVRDPKVWGEIGLATGAFGYGMMVTPLQLAAAFATIARGGEWIAPRIVAEIRDGAGRVIYRPEPTRRRAVTTETAHDMMTMLEMVMQKGGTGDSIKVPGFRVAGKTGTAHKVDPATHRYSATMYLSSFSGIVPADDPRLVIVVMIDEPNGGQHYGGVVAGPVFARIASESLKYLGVAGREPIEDATASKPNQITAAAASEPEITDDVTGTAAEPPALDAAIDADSQLPPAGPGEAIVVIPDFTGLSVGQALAAARAAGVTIEIEGSGRAIKQFPPPGRAMKSITCRLTFDPG